MIYRPLLSMTYMESIYKSWLEKSYSLCFLFDGIYSKSLRSSTPFSGMFFGNLRMSFHRQYFRKHLLQ